MTDAQIAAVQAEISKLNSQRLALIAADQTPKTPEEDVKAAQAEAEFDWRMATGDWDK